MENKNNIEKQLFNHILKELDSTYTIGSPIENNTGLLLHSQLANISLNEALNNIYMLKKKKILANYNLPKHPANSDGYYHFRLHGKKYKRKSLSELENLCIHDYLQNTRTLTTIYVEFRNYKIKTGKSSGTIHKYDSYITFVEGTDFGDIPLEQIKPLDYINWASEIITTNHMTLKRFAQIRYLVNQMFQYAIFSGEIEINPIRDVKNSSFENLFSAPKKHEKHEDALTPEQVKLLLEYCEKKFAETNNPVSLIPAILTLTGLRIGECIALTYGAFNFIDETLTINRMLVDAHEEIEGKLRKTGSQLKEHAKCRHAGDEDTIFIESKVIEYVEQIRIANRNMGYPTSNTDFLFMRCNRYTDYKPDVITKRSLDRVMKSISNDLGFEFVYSPHDLRRTYVSMLALAGTPLKDIQHQVRHSTPEMTLKYFRNNQSDSAVKKNISDMMLTIQNS